MYIFKIPIYRSLQAGAQVGCRTWVAQLVSVPTRFLDNSHHFCATRITALSGQVVLLSGQGVSFVNLDHLGQRQYNRTSGNGLF